jgi:hypothetical protein
MNVSEKLVFGPTIPIIGWEPSPRQPFCRIDGDRLHGITTRQPPQRPTRRMPPAVWSPPPLLSPATPYSRCSSSPIAPRRRSTLCTFRDMLARGVPMDHFTPPPVWILSSQALALKLGGRTARRTTSSWCRRWCSATRAYRS